MGYFKLFIYYFISLIDALINFLCAIVGYYPALEMAQDYIVSRELKRIGGELQDHDHTRAQDIHKADSLVQEAKSLEG